MASRVFLHNGCYEQNSTLILFGVTRTPPLYSSVPLSPYLPLWLQASTLIVYAKTAPQLGDKGITAFIVERGMPGFSTAQVGYIQLWGEECTPRHA